MSCLLLIAQCNNEPPFPAHALTLRIYHAIYIFGLPTENVVHPLHYPTSSQQLQLHCQQSMAIAGQPLREATRVPSVKTAYPHNHLSVQPTHTQNENSLPCWSAQLANRIDTDMAHGVIYWWSHGYPCLSNEMKHANQQLASVSLMLQVASEVDLTIPYVENCSWLKYFVH